MSETVQTSLQNNRRFPVSGSTLILVSILLLAGFSRLYDLDQTPPGLNQDEACNAWNAYCLLKTGMDQAGVSWPVFYMRGLGGHRATLHIYLLMPFQAIGGMNVITTRLPAAVGGVLAVLVIYYAGKRLFGPAVGLVAAGLLTLNPWHLQQSRWGQDAALAALFGIAPLAMMLWANLPLSDDSSRAPRRAAALLAGIVSGICCYGYHSMRIFIPVFLLAVVLVSPVRWWRCFKTRKGVLAIIAFVVGFTIFFGPLAWQHIFHAEGISRHGQAQPFLLNSQSPLFGLGEVALRYIRHFGLDFLFVNGDMRNLQSPPGIGQLHWYMLPVMITGLVVIVRRFRASYSARILLAFLIVYPVGDILFPYIPKAAFEGMTGSHALVNSMHALRSLPGLCSLILLGSFGAVTACGWLRRKNRPIAAVVITIFVLAVAGLNIRYLGTYYGKYSSRQDTYHSFHSDLVEACDWLGPRLDNYDALFFSSQGFNMPYIISLVTLNYDPEKWHKDIREYIPKHEWDVCTRYGDTHFIYGRSFLRVLDEWKASGKEHRFAFVVRPGELGLKGQPVHKINRPDGQATLYIYEVSHKPDPSADQRR